LIALIFSIEVGPNGTIDRLKAHLVTYKIFGLDCNDTFSLVEKIIVVHLFIAIVTLQQ